MAGHLKLSKTLHSHEGLEDLNQMIAELGKKNPDKHKLKKISQKLGININSNTTQMIEELILLLDQENFKALPTLDL